MTSPKKIPCSQARSSGHSFRSRMPERFRVSPISQNSGIYGGTLRDDNSHWAAKFAGLLHGLVQAASPEGSSHLADTRFGSGKSDRFSCRFARQGVRENSQR